MSTAHLAAMVSHGGGREGGREGGGGGGGIRGQSRALHRHPNSFAYSSMLQQVGTQGNQLTIRDAPRMLQGCSKDAPRMLQPVEAHGDRTVLIYIH